MLASAPIETIPIYADEFGRLRIGQTRVLLELVIYSFRAGYGAESIAEQYPSLSLEEVYWSIGYYLRHRDELDAYVSQQESEAEAARQTWQAQQTTPLTKEALLARLAAQRESHAPVGLNGLVNFTIYRSRVFYTPYTP